MQRNFIRAACLALLAVLLAYSNHFLSPLHYSDATSVRDNSSIRRLVNIPRFFFDSSTSNTEPAGYVYHPIVTTSHAIEYFLGKGAPFFYHLPAFLIYLAGLAAIAWLFFLIFEHAIPHPWNAYLAIMGAALFGLHPATAELLNSVSQHGELYAALCVVAGVALYADLPGKRRYGYYLVPPLIGILASPSGLVFGPLLLAYILLIEPAPLDESRQPLSADQIRSRDQTQAPETSTPSASGPKRIRIRRRKHPFRRYLKAQLQRFLPALAFTAGGCFLESLANSFNPLGEVAVSYWFTQPYVAWRYFRSFFWPFHLSPASDLAVFGSYDIHAVLGLAFVLALVSLALLLAVSPQWRPTVLGLWWFLLALLPGAILMQNDVESDTRMFLPSIGLALAVTWTARMMLPSGEPLRRLQAIAASLLLVALGVGTFHRNQVWSSDETLWRDAVDKNPASVRALQYYAMALDAKGRPADAYQYLWKARRDNPKSAEVEALMGSVSGDLGRSDEAEDHFRHALYLAADQPVCHFLFAVWLEKQGRRKAAIDAYSWASSLAPSDLRPRYGTMRLYSAEGDWNNLKRTVEEVQEMAPGDPQAFEFAALLRDHPDTVKEAELLVKEHPTPENYVTLSSNYCLAGDFNRCLDTAQKALQLRPGYVAAYINMGSACMSLGRLDEAIAAARKALELDPDNQAAHNNLRDWENEKLLVGNAIMRK